MVNFVEGVLKVPICVVAVAKHPPSDGVNDGFSLCLFRCPVRWAMVLGEISGHSGEGLHHKAT